MRLTSSTWLASVCVLAAGCAFFPQDEGESSEEEELDTGGGSVQGPIGSFPPPGGSAPTPDEGFAAVEGLGACPAIYAEAPEEHYQALTFRPCADGAPRCEEVVWDGTVEWDPTGSGSLLVWEPQIGLGSDGHASHLLLMHRYPRYSGGGGLPFEAVVYAFDSGTPIAAWRNEGLVGSSPYCELVPVLGQGRLWLLGFAGGTHQVGIATSLLGEPVPDSVRASTIDKSVLTGRKAATALVLGLESSDGRLYHIDAGLRITEAFGPGMRLWLHSAVGDQIIAGTNQVNPPANTYFRFDKDGFQMLLPSVGALATDGRRLAWIEPGPTPSERLLKLGAVDATRTLVVDESATITLPVSQEPAAILLAGDRALVVVGESFSASRGALIDLASQRVMGEVAVPAQLGRGGQAIGIENDHVWIGAEGRSDDSSFEQLRRTAYAPTM